MSLMEDGDDGAPGSLDVASVLRDSVDIDLDETQASGSVQHETTNVHI